MKVVDLGLRDYAQTLILQRKLHELCASGAAQGFLLKVEHPPTLTLGKNASPSHVLKQPSEEVRTYRVERGGEVTAHMPGQIVLYPVLPLRRWELTPKKHVHWLEELAICVCGDYEIDAWRDSQFPGVWTQQGKVCAVGVRIKDRTTMHGVAINVRNDFELFEAITPCGIEGRSVTSLSRILGRMISIEEVWAKMLVFIGERFGEPDFCGDFDSLLETCNLNNYALISEAKEITEAYS